jgi:putative PEP-CTERM system TPR-repeat lipoprotein
MRFDPWWPTGLRVLAASVAVVALTACTAEKSVKDSLADAEAALAQNETATLFIEAKRALQSDPESAPARRLLGLALLRSGDAVGAEAALRRALKLGQPTEQTVPALASSLLAQGQFKPLTDEFADTRLALPGAQAELKTALAEAYRAQGEAALFEAALDAALQAEPAHTPALLMRARHRAIQGDSAGALASSDALLKTQPADANIWLLKGDLLRDFAQQPDAALAAYRQAAALRPQLAGPQLDVAETLLRLGRIDEAEAPLAAGQRLAPHAARGIYLQTVRALARSELAVAEKGAQVLLAAAPDNPRFLLLAGDVAQRAGSLAQAAQHLERTLQLAPQAVPARRLLASVQLRQGEPAKALTTLQPLLEVNATPDPATATLAGDAWRATGNTAQAERQYAIAARLDPGNTRARTALALTRMATGKVDAGFTELREAAEAGAGIGPDLALITTHLARQELPQALAAIDALQRKLPASPLPPNLRGRALLGARDLPGARASFERALVITPTYFPAIDGLAAVDVMQRQPDAARQRFEALIEKQPGHGAALLALANLRAISGASPSEVAALLERAIAAQPSAAAPRLRLIDMKLRASDAPGALAAAQDAVSALPQSAEALDALGRVQLARGEHEDGIATLRKAAALQPRDPLPLLRLAAAQRVGKQAAAAAETLRRALVLRPDLMEAQHGLVTIAVESRDFPAALAVARAVQTQRPKEAAGYLLEGEVEATQKRWAAAASVYRRGLDQLPSIDLARQAHAALGAAGDTAGRDRFAAAWLNDHPRDAAFRLYLGDVSAAQRDFAGAEKLYTAAVQLQPTNADALNNLAWVGGKLGRPGALAHAEKAVALAPDNAGHIDTLAMLLAQNKDYPQALARQRKAVGLQPANGLFRLNLARILVLAGQKEEARRELKVLAALGDKFGGQSEVARLVKTL